MEERSIVFSKMKAGAALWNDIWTVVVRMKLNQVNVCGTKTLDVGCGPGHLSAAFEFIMGPSGKVIWIP